MPLTLVGKSTWNTLRNVYVDTILDLPTAEREGIVFVSGAQRVNDGSGGWFKYQDSVARSIADGNEIIDPTGTGLGNGCWVRQKFFSAPSGSNFSEVQTAIAGQTVFNLTKFTYTPGQGDVAVYVNGTRQTPTAFTESSSSQITLLVPTKVGDLVEIIGHDRPTSGTTILIDAKSVNFDPTTSMLVSRDVQAALEELSRSKGSGGGASNAANVAYGALAPDLKSRNVQDGMHWLHNRILGHERADPAHVAAFISYDDRMALLGAANVQVALDQLKLLLDGLGTDDISYSPTQQLDLYLAQLQNQVNTNKTGISTHLTTSVNAHTARMISYNGTDQIYINAGAVDVDDALNELAQQIHVHTHKAIQVSYDNTASGMASNEVKGALDELMVALNTHRNTLSGAHLSSGIRHTPSGGMTSTDLQVAINEIWNGLQGHITTTTVSRARGAHMASAIGFSTVGNGFRSNDVQAAIVEAAGVGMIYRGTLDLTVAYVPPVPAPSANSYFMASKAGAVDASWSAVANGLPVTVGAGDMLAWNGAKYDYLPNTGPSLAQVIQRLPTAGDGQTIQSAAAGHTVLTLDGVPGQTAALLRVAGNVDVDILNSRGTISDATGNLRQNALQVPFVSGSGLVGTNVRAGLDELHVLWNQHRATTTLGVHAAGSISFTPVSIATNNNVQQALGDVATYAQGHVNSNQAHAATKITFDNTVSGMAASDVQAAIDEIKQIPAGGAADMFLAKKTATDRDIEWRDTIDLGTY